MLSAINNILFSPVALIRPLRRRRIGASTDTPPTLPPDETECEIGAYCIRATVDAYDNDGCLDKSFIGYSKNLDIVQKTEFACERLKRKGTSCQDVALVFKGGDCVEQIFMRNKNGELIHIKSR